jgi:hypothetical protein
MAAGALARGEVALDLRLPTCEDADDADDADEAQTAAAGPAAAPTVEQPSDGPADAGVLGDPRPRGRRRELVLHVHLHAHAVGGELVLDPVADVANTRSHVLLGQVREWCSTPGGTVTIRPVLDLAEHLEVPGYTPSPRLRRQVELTHPECVFPHCHRPSTGCDLDHVVPHARGGPTCSCNLVPLCRRHHRLKTHAGWRLQRTGHRLLVWTSPHGRVYTVHHGHTDDLTDQSAGTTPPPDRHSG